MLLLSLVTTGVRVAGRWLVEELGRGTRVISDCRNSSNEQDTGIVKHIEVQEYDGSKCLVRVAQPPVFKANSLRL